MRALGTECCCCRPTQDLVSPGFHPFLLHLSLTQPHSFACAVREAYAAAITVVILIEGQQYDDNE